MARAVCPKCLRPQKTCICDFIESIDNQIELGILQHPDEVTQSKGTAIIAQLSLMNVKTWVGESMQELSELKEWLDSAEKIVLLYPEIEQQIESFQCFSIEQLQQLKANYKVLVLDGTWRKTFKIMQTNPELCQLDRVVLNPVKASEYKIRKQKNQDSLSSVEAIYQLLSQLENNPQKFQPLVDAFQQMQLQYRK